MDQRVASAGFDRMLNFQRHPTQWAWSLDKRAGSFGSGKEMVLPMRHAKWDMILHGEA